MRMPCCVRLAARRPVHQRAELAGDVGDELRAQLQQAVACGQGQQVHAGGRAQPAAHILKGGGGGHEGRRNGAGKHGVAERGLPVRVCMQHQTPLDNIHKDRQGLLALPSRHCRCTHAVKVCASSDWSRNPSMMTMHAAWNASFLPVTEWRDASCT